MTRVVGVDATLVRGRPAWIAVELDDGGLSGIRLHGSWREVLDRARDAEAVGVDLPVGHDDPDGEARGGRRRADVEARRRLGPRGDAVDLVPPLVLLEEDSLEKARDRADREGWDPLPQRIWDLRDPIGEVNRTARDDDRVFEVHPEVSFQAMRDPAGGDHLDHPPGSRKGRHERLELLHEAGLRPGRSLGGVGRADPMDVLDASAAAWSADRIARLDRADTLPEDPPADPATGRPVAIWY